VSEARRAGGASLRIAGEREERVGMRPTFSVIVPVHNDESHVGAAIESVVAQTWRDWELLVVDDASTDGTWEVLQDWAGRDERIQLLRLTENMGPGAARNAALRRARGQYVAYLDSDDRYYPDYLEKAAHFLERGDVAVFQCEVCVEVKGERVRVGRWETTAGAGRLFEACVMVPLCVAHRKELVERVGGFGEDRWLAEEWDLWLRFARSGAVFVYVEHPAGEYTVRGGSRTRRPRAPARQWQQWEGRVREGRELYEGEGEDLRRVERACFITGGWPLDPWNVAAQAAYRLLQLLALSGYRCSLVCTSQLLGVATGEPRRLLRAAGWPCAGPGEEMVVFTDGGVEIRCLAAEGMLGGWDCGRVLARLTEVFQGILREEAPEVVLTDGSVPVAQGWLRMARLVDRITGVAFRDYQGLPGEWLLLGSSDYCFVGSEYARQ
jgi:teichuronic acid biosynthesis glycosyltransferase TuaG